MTSWLVRPRTGTDAAIRCFGFPYAGVGSSAFRGWAAALGPQVELIAVQPPGRESRLREKPLSDVMSLARGAADAMAPLLDRPYAVIGHSLGAIVAFETVRELRARGVHDPVHLFVSASRAPHIPWVHPPLRHLDDLALLQEIDGRYGGTVPRQLMASGELRTLFVPGLRGDCAALETYEYVTGSPLRCPISAFAGTHDTMVPQSVIEEWRRHTTGTFTLRVIEGPHLFLQTAQRQLVALVNQDLASGAASPSSADQAPTGLRHARSATRQC